MRKCENCLWAGQCFIDGGCDDFSPVEEQVDEIIESGREGYMQELVITEAERMSNNKITVKDGETYFEATSLSKVYL